MSCHYRPLSRPAYMVIAAAVGAVYGGCRRRHSMYMSVFSVFGYSDCYGYKSIYKNRITKINTEKNAFFSSLGPFFRVRRSYSACVAASDACLAAHVRAALFCRTGRTISANHRPMSINYSIFATVSVPRVPHPTTRTTAARHKLKALQ